jgi:hypothetical protein
VTGQVYPLLSQTSANCWTNFTDVLKWMGRHPVPRKYRDFMPRNQQDWTTMWRAPGICTILSNGLRTGTFLTFDRLFDRLAAYLASDYDRAVLFSSGWD